MKSDPEREGMTTSNPSSAAKERLTKIAGLVFTVVLLINSAFMICNAISGKNVLRESEQLMKAATSFQGYNSSA